MPVTCPAGVRRDPQAGAQEVDGESALRAVGRAVAIACLPVAYQLVSLDQPGKSEVVPVHSKGRHVESDLAEGRRARGPPIMETIARLLPRTLVRTIVRPDKRLVVHLGIVVLLAADQRQVLLGGSRVHPVAVDRDVPARHQ